MQIESLTSNANAPDRSAQQLTFVAEIDKLKDVLQRNFVSGSRRNENSAEHSWHLALMALVLLEHCTEPGMDRLQILKLVLVHDIVEIDAGTLLGTTRPAMSRKQIGRKRRPTASSTSYPRIKPFNFVNSGMSLRRGGPRKPGWPKDWIALKPCSRVCIRTESAGDNTKSPRPKFWNTTDPSPQPCRPFGRSFVNRSITSRSKPLRTSDGRKRTILLIDTSSIEIRIKQTMNPTTNQLSQKQPGSMRIFLAGASGVIGQRLIPRLVQAGHVVGGMTRSTNKTALLSHLGAKPILCDVFDREALIQAVRDFKPDVVLNELTDLPDDVTQISKYGDLNARIRTEETRNIIEAARQSGSPKILAQSVAWQLPDGPDAKAVAELERSVLAEGGVVLSYGMFYGPGTYNEQMPTTEPRVHIDRAADRTVEALREPSGVVVITD